MSDAADLVTLLDEIPIVVRNHDNSAADVVPETGMRCE